MEPELLDIGAQAERTALSWQRTGIGVIVAGALVLRWCVTVGYPLWPGIALAASGSVISLFIVRHRYRRVVRTVSAGQTPTSRYLIPGTALFMVLVVLALTIAIIVTPGMAHADNSRLNNSVVANADTVRNHAGCTTDVKKDPALAINNLEIINQWYYDPTDFAIMSDCANTSIGVWSENSLDRSVVVAVYGQGA